MKFTFVLLAVLLVELDACNPDKEYQLLFPERTDTDYAIKENAIVYNLNAVTVCYFALDDPDDSSSDNQCPFSYAISSMDNELTFCAVPDLRVLIHGERRDASVGIEDGKWHHVCFTWSNTNGDYQFYKDGKLVHEGTEFQKGVTIKHGGTAVIGQDQDTLGGGFDSDQAFVGSVTQLNVWGTVLSESDILAQYSNCHVTQGSVIRWSQFKDNVHGGAIVIEP